MVRKSEKYGVRSGNTFRASNSKYNRLYKTKSSLVRNLKDTDSTNTILDELAIDFDGIEYSLNKKGRWMIPQLIKEDILSNKNQQSNDVKVQLFESHKIKRAAKCIGFYSSKGPVRKVVSRKKTYFDGKNVLNKNKNKRKSKSGYFNKIQNRNDESDVQKPSPELNIEVFYPSPITSSITHNPKYIRNWIPPWKKAIDEDNQRSKVTSKNGRTKRRARINSKRIVESLLDNYLEISDDENNEAEFSSDKEHRSRGVELEDIFYHAFKMLSLCVQTPIKDACPKSSHKDAEQRKATDVTKLTNTQNDSVNSEECEPKKTAEMLPVYVILPSADIQTHSLKQIYGESYMECQCFPRKFVIDITDRVMPFPKKVKGSQALDFMACVIFEYDMNNDVDSPDGNLYKVYLNLKSKIDILQIETIPEFMQTTIDEVIQRTAFFVETIPADSFHVMTSKTNPCNKKTVKFQNLDECLGTSTEAYYPSSRLVYRDIFRGTQDADEIDGLDDLGFECVPPETCYICFESICTGEKAATSLQSCGHWFCDQCWQDHIRSKMDMGNHKITCPEYKCSSQVDYATLLTLVNVQFVEHLAKREHDNKVNMFKETKWCPDPNCGRVLKVNKVMKSLNVKCVCGKTVCFDCLQPAHWPASCNFMVNYWSKLSESGFKDVPQEKFVTSQFTFYGKNCPQCFQFIEKFGGCNNMVCCCGAEFCWACLKLNSDHSILTCEIAGDKDKTKMIKIRSYIHDGILSSSSYSKLYKMAVSHRANRHPWKTQFMKSNMWVLTSMLKAYIKKCGNEYGMELSEYTNSDNIQKHIEQIPTFLTSMMELYVEMNYVIEYTAVYLQEEDRGNSDVMPVLERLVYLADSIYEIFSSGVDQDIRLIISNLWELRQHSKHNIDGLVKIVTTKSDRNDKNIHSESESSEDDFVLL